MLDLVERYGDAQQLVTTVTSRDLDDAADIAPAADV